MQQGSVLTLVLSVRIGCLSSTVLEAKHTHTHTHLTPYLDVPVEACIAEHMPLLTLYF